MDVYLCVYIVNYIFAYDYMKKYFFYLSKVKTNSNNNMNVFSISQNDKDKNLDNERKQRKRHSHILLMGMENGEISFTTSIKNQNAHAV